MPVYTYRREDGTTFDIKQKFSDDDLTVDPETGQRVTRIVQATSIIFKGSGFYVNDSKGKSSTASTPIETSKDKAEKTTADNGNGAKAEAPKAEKTEAPAASKPAPETKTKKAATSSAAAD